VKTKRTAETEGAKLHGIGKTGALSIKKACGSASQLAHGDAWVVSVA
jgi:hypothetical protein